MENQKYAEVIPLVRLPKSLGIFDYKVPKELADGMDKGDLIEIPWRKNTIDGIVLSKKNTLDIPDAKIKEIIRIKEKKFLTPNQLELALWMSKYYFQSLALIIKSIVPPLLKKTPEKNKKKQIHGATILYNEAPKYAEMESQKKILLEGNYPGGLFHELAYSHVLKNEQTLILLPEISSIHAICEEYEKLFGKGNIVLMGGRQPKKTHYENWKKISTNEAKIIIGTRRAAFAPFAKLSLIIMDSEEDSSFKQWDQNPRYNARDIALRLSETNNTQLVLASRAPSVVTHSKTYKNFSLHFFPWKEKNIEVIDLKNKSGFFSKKHISPELQNALRALSGQAVIIVNRKGSSGSVTCKHCGHTFICDTCRVPFSYYKDSQDELVCQFCGKRRKLDTLCPVCDSAEFHFSLAGTKKIAEEIVQEFPKYKNAVGIIDGDASVAERKKIITEFSKNTIKIIVGTQAIFNDLNINRELDLVALICADTFLNVPEYYSEELTWQLLIKSISLAKNAIIQTYAPQNPTIELASKLDFTNWYAQEMQKRKIFRYPPFSKIIKIIIQENKQENAISFSQKISHRMRQYINEHKLTSQIIGPIIPRIPLVRGRFRVHVIIKIIDNKENIDNVIKLVPDECLIDVEPISLL